MTDEPLLVEDEEEENKHNTRSAYWAGRFDGGDSFTGSFRGVPAPRRGGAQYVKDSDMPLGDEEHCWCGQDLGHNWPGKNKGAPHPRGDQVSAMADEKPYLNPRDLRAWDRRVVRALCELVNTYGVEYRIDKDHMHIYLSVPGTTDEEIPRMKAGRSRSAEQSLAMLERWAEKYIRPVVTEKAAEVLAEKLNDPTKKPHGRTTKERSDAAAAAHARKRSEAPQGAATPSVAPTPTPAPEAPREAASQASETLEFVGDDEDNLDFGAPDGYHQHVSRKGAVTNWWEKDGGGHWICKAGDYETNHIQGGGAHQRMHSMTKDERAEVSRSAGLSADHELQARRTKARNAIKFLAAEYDIKLATDQNPNTREVGRLKKQIERLEADLASVTRQRDDLQAWKDLILEASR